MVRQMSTSQNTVWKIKCCVISTPCTLNTAPWVKSTRRVGTCSISARLKWKIWPKTPFLQYQGTWYEISKFETPAEKGGKCGKAEYTVDGEIVKVKNSHIVNGVLSSIEGTAKFADDAKGSAKLLVTLNFGGECQDFNTTFDQWLHCRGSVFQTG